MTEHAVVWDAESEVLAVMTLNEALSRATGAFVRSRRPLVILGTHPCRAWAERSAAILREARRVRA